MSYSLEVQAQNLVQWKRELVGTIFVILLRENPRLGRRLRKRDRRIHVWTVNTTADLDLCAAAGVEAVITDNPRMALDHFDGPSTPQLPV